MSGRFVGGAHHRESFCSVCVCVRCCWWDKVHCKNTTSGQCVIDGGWVIMTPFGVVCRLHGFYTVVGGIWFVRCAMTQRDDDVTYLVKSPSRKWRVGKQKVCKIRLVRALQRTFSHSSCLWELWLRRFASTHYIKQQFKTKLTCVCFRHHNHASINYAP